MSKGAGSLERSLGPTDAIVIGVGSMVGAGVYSVWTAASRSAGQFLLIGLVVAATVAVLNALSSARLAVMYPESGGTYVYGRERLGDAWGFVAGWSFVAGKTASCAAMASTVGAYLLPQEHRLAAIGAIVLITGVNIGGLQRTVGVTKFLLAVSGGILVLVVLSGWTHPGFDASRAWPWSSDTDVRSTGRQVYDTLQAAGLLFFAFAGYARIATLGEEVRDPDRTIPRAIMISLTGVLVLYGIIGVTVLATLSPDGLSTTDPLRQVVESGSFDGLVPFVRIGAVIAGLGALLNLVPGVSRTVLAMARRRDAPVIFAHIDSRNALPVRAELTVAALACSIVLIFDLRSSIALSGVGVLVYYSITNASAMTLPSRTRERIPAVVGLVGCLSLVVCLPVHVLSTGAAVLGVGMIARLAHDRLMGRTS